MLIMQTDYSLISAKGIFCKANNQIDKRINTMIKFFVVGPIKRA